MDNRRTPNHSEASGSRLHPKSASASKFARPRSLRKADTNSANSTILLGSNNHKASTMGSARIMNQTVSHNLDVTMSAHSNPRIKSNFAVPATDVDLEYDLAYNEYLQALMKQQIVKRTIRQHEETLNDQILIQSEHLYKLEKTCKEICDKIENLKILREKAEILDNLKDGMNQIENLCQKFKTQNSLDQLNCILTEESNMVSVRNIKPIGNQQEYDELIATLNGLAIIMEKIHNSGRNLEEVNKLATAIKNFNELREKVEETAGKVCNIRKKAVTVFINQASDMFAEQGGYK